MSSTPDTNSWQFLATLAGVGAAISLFQTLASTDKVSWRIAAGRAGVTAGIAMGSAALLIIIPGMSMVAAVGLAAAFASLGTSALERTLGRILGPKDNP